MMDIQWNTVSRPLFWYKNRKNLKTKRANYNNLKSNYSKHIDVRAHEWVSEWVSKWLIGILDKKLIK